MVISTEAREKCLAKVRKRVKHREKWGWVDVTLEFALAMACFAGFGFIFYLISTRLAAILGQNQAAQDAVTLGWATGVALGFSSGLLVLKGTLSIVQGVQTLSSPLK